jgi:glycosyltransferase involved in cell wall biosynthesis
LNAVGDDRPIPTGMQSPAARNHARPISVLVATHSHPGISKGGAELAAWRLFQGLRDHPDWQAWFMGCGRELAGARLGSNITQPFGPDEFLYSSNQFDWFKFANKDARYPRELTEMLLRTRPDILHFHHYVNFGVETFLIAKRALPDCKIVLTLHEFQAICNHYGQMVTKQTRSLCYESSPRDCNKCFPDVSRSDFFLRAEYIRRFFDCVDLFTSPSQFLADRYIAWGIPAEKMVVIENVIPVPLGATEAVPAKRAALRVGFFGQISFLKGIHVLLEAARMLEDDEDCDVVFDIHGDYSNQPVEFQEDFVARLAKAGRNVRFQGPYDNNRVDALMRAVDLVLIPSIWWENSPVVIQECLRNRRPIICSNIGGMAEKVRPGLDGWHFQVGSAYDLSTQLRELFNDRSRLTGLSETMQVPAAPQGMVERHIALYRALLPMPEPVAVAAPLVEAAMEAEPPAAAPKSAKPKKAARR